jgi:hypothetical protein
MTTPFTVVPTVLLKPVDRLPVTSEAMTVFPAISKEKSMAGMSDIFNKGFFIFFIV